MLSIIALGIGFILLALGSIYGWVVVIATPIEKRKGYTGSAGQIFFWLLGLLVISLTLLQEFHIIMTK